MTDQPPLPEWTSAGPASDAPAPAPAVPAGWYADPAAPGQPGALRYWDGAGWTGHVSGMSATAWVPPSESFGFVESVRRAFRRWSDFSGRATVAEFWWFFLFSYIASFVLYIPLFAALVALLSGTAVTDSRGRTTLTGTPGAGTIAVIVVFGVIFFVGSLVLWFVQLALSVRRLHDTGRSGWWYLISFVPLAGLVLFYFWLLPSDPGPNLYGPPST